MGKGYTSFYEGKGQSVPALFFKKQLIMAVKYDIIMEK